MATQKRQRPGRKTRLRLRTTSDLARHLKMREDYLLELANELDTPDSAALLYKSWQIPKKGSGFRRIDAPRQKLKWVQKRINALILQRMQAHKTAKGGVRGSNLKKNAQPHVGQPMVANFDLQDFFSNVSSGQVYSWFCHVGCAPTVARLLTRLTTFNGCLPQGAPTSSALAVLVMHPLNARIEGFASQHGANHTLYVDDLTLSGPSYLRQLERPIYRIIEQSGAAPNVAKTKFRSQNERQEVTGVVVNKKLSINREKRRQLRALLYQCQILGPAAMAAKYKHPSVEALRGYLGGSIGHVRNVNTQQGDDFLAQFKKIDWSR